MLSFFVKSYDGIGSFRRTEVEDLKAQMAQMKSRLDALETENAEARSSLVFVKGSGGEAPKVLSLKAGEGCPRKWQPLSFAGVLRAINRARDSRFAARPDLRHAALTGTTATALPAISSTARLM